MAVPQPELAEWSGKRCQNGFIGQNIEADFVRCHAKSATSHILGEALLSKTQQAADSLESAACYKLTKVTRGQG